MTNNSKILVYGQAALEFLLLNICLLFGFKKFLPYVLGNKFPSLSVMDYLQLLVVFNISWLIMVIVNNNHEIYFNISFRKRAKNLVVNTFFFVGLAFTFGLLFKLKYFNSATFLASTVFFAFITLANLSIFRLIIAFFKFKNRKGLARKVLVVDGSHEENWEKQLAAKLNSNTVNLVGVIGNNGKVNGQIGNGVIANVKDISSVLDKTEVDEIYISLASLKDDEIKQAIKAADYHGVRVNLIQDAPQYLNNGSGFKTSAAKPVVKLREYPLDSHTNYFIKKLFDFVVALTAMIFLFPIFTLIAILIKWDSRGPLFYTPLRKGEEGETFKCYKFRTMSVCDDPVNGKMSTVKNDPRVTRVGKWLRKFDLDELPQILNVLKGDMSLVGPRPHRVHLHNDFRENVNQYMVRHYVKPGLTGWAQVNGWRGPAETMEAKEGRVSHDLWYIQNWSLWLDIKIIFMTAFSRNARKNAF